MGAVSTASANALISFVVDGLVGNRTSERARSPCAVVLPWCSS